MKEKRFRAFWANFVIVATLVTMFGIVFVAALPIDTSAKAVNNAIYEGVRDGGGVALTFNVYENATNVEKIADILDEYGFSATFFVGGSWAAKNQNLLIKLSSRGFEIGNHGYMHRNHSALTLKQNKDEIIVTERIIDGTLSELLGYANCKLFAPPSGNVGAAMFNACTELGYKVIMWTRDTIDWRDRDDALVYERAVRDVKAGDIVLMHPTDHTVRALPRILEHLGTLGLKADTVSNVI